LKDNLSELVFESCGRIFSCIARKRYEDIYCASIETLLEMRTALCLLNCTHVNYDYFDGIQESFKFKKLPERYPVLATSCGRAEVRSALQMTSEISSRTISPLLREEQILQT
jgi:kanamycin nucleotidyltransferase